MCRALAVGCTLQVTALKRARRDKKGECVEEQKGVGECLMEKRMEMREWFLREKRGKEKEGVK